MKTLLNRAGGMRHWLFIVLGCLMDALAANLFLVGNDIAAGGLAGIATVLIRILPLKLSVLLVLMNVPIVVVSYFVKGWKFVRNSVVGFVVYTILVEVTSCLPTLTDNRLLAAICGGGFYGLGVAFMTLGGGSVGGTELIIRILVSLFPQIGIDGFGLVVDGTVVVFAMLVYRDIEAGLYAILTIVIYSRLVNPLVNRIVWGQEHGDLCIIITKHDEKEVAGMLMHEMGIAVTKLSGIGMYSHAPQNVLMAAVHGSDTYRLREILSGADYESFVVVLPVNEVLGGRLGK